MTEIDEFDSNPKQSQTETKIRRLVDNENNLYFQPALYLSRVQGSEVYCCVASSSCSFLASCCDLSGLLSASNTNTWVHVQKYRKWEDIQCWSRQHAHTDVGCTANYTLPLPSVLPFKPGHYPPWYITFSLANDWHHWIPVLTLSKWHFFLQE